jgi:(p)ppGpp synthase/HD superfamily hydrolase
MIKDEGLPEFAQRFAEAFRYAAVKHAAQRRKATSIPYVSHLLAAASLVLEAGGDEDEAIAALLHDAVEDQGGLPTLEEIRTLFGDSVAAIVQGCTDTDVTPKPPWRARKEAHLEHLRHASRSVRLVATADKLHNLRCTVADYRAEGEALWTRFNSPREDQLWYYRSIAEALKSPDNPLVAELDRGVTELERLAAAGPSL